MANTLYDALFLAHEGRERTFLALKDGDTISYGAFLRQTARFAHALRACGVAPGDRVALQAKKSPQALAVYAATRWAANRARSNAGPTLIEHFTYRAEGHSTSDDPSQYRSAQERSTWPLGDPIVRLKNHLIALGEWDEDRQAAMDQELAEAVKAATRAAEANGVLGHGLHHPFHTMFEDVFETLPWHLQEQSEQAMRERRIKWPDWRPEDGDDMP